MSVQYTETHCANYATVRTSPSDGGNIYLTMPGPASLTTTEARRLADALYYHADQAEFAHQERWTRKKKFI